MRYALVSKGLSIEDLKVEAAKVGAKGIVSTTLNQIFCELTDEQASALAANSSLAVKPLKSIKPDAVMIPDIAVEQVQGQSSSVVWDVFDSIRKLFDPPITGAGLTVAILDTGIRETHESLKDKVVYEANFSNSPNADDVFGHGTQTAFIVAGGSHGGEKVGVSPGASLMNIKVMDDTGNATEEEVVLGIERVCQLVQDAMANGLQPLDPMWPNVINLSLGAEDDGDEDSPMRVACRVAVLEYGIDVVAAAGNLGPDMTTITSPGTEPQVITVGAINTVYEVSIWDRSSRGPTKLGDIKPDFVFWGVDVEAASDKNDTDYVTKSGTSFSTPMLSGLTGLLWESGRLAYGGNWLFRWIEARPLGPYYCLKPLDAPLTQDNSYGYGLPAVGTMVSRLASGGRAVGVAQMITPMMLMMMIMSMMKVMA